MPLFIYSCQGPLLQNYSDSPLSSDRRFSIILIDCISYVGVCARACLCGVGECVRRIRYICH